MGKNIVLLGFMGTGKTSIARQLAEDLSMKFVETDSVIEEREGIIINEIFRTKGEPYFRKLESDVIEELASGQGLVISAGGGVVLNNQNINTLKENGILICLDAEPEETLRRVAHEKHRPLLNVKNPLQKIKELLNFRKPYYDKISVHVDTNKKTIEEIVREIKIFINPHYS